MTLPATSPRAVPPRGMTLMEVLIACGILVLGLSSIAALLPAAGARLGQANVEDRAGTLAANAYTDILTRGLVAADLFGDHTKSVAFGQGMSAATANLATQFEAPTAFLTQRIDPQRGFLLEDELLFAPPATAATPINEFLQGRRSFKEAICWGATLVPESFPAAAAELPGTPARLSVAVFRKTPESFAIALEAFNGVYRMAPPNEAMAPPNELLRAKFLRSCSYVLVPFKDSTRGPRWFRITASWIAPIDPVTRQRADPNCYVIFDDAGAEKFADFAGSAPTIVGFDGIVRLDEYNVILE